MCSCSVHAVFDIFVLVRLEQYFEYEKLLLVDIEGNNNENTTLRGGFAERSHSKLAYW